MGWYCYSQNNSGGSFVGPHYVIVQAASSDEADEKAEDGNVVYFGGVAAGHDCSCCGDRWRQSMDDEGDDVPTIWGKPVDLVSLEYDGDPVVLIE